MNRRIARNTPPAALPSWQLVLCAAVLVTATLLAFAPAFRARFITWDDPQYVSGNALLQDRAGLMEIWRPFSGKLPQYYPLTFSSYWIEYQLWQRTPAGYHATNVVLHAINVVLVLQLVRVLGASLWVAAGAAAVFAVHPVQVESVVWITERKNALSGLFYLIAFLCYLRHRRTGGWGAYAATLAALACALLSKTQTATLPVVLVFTDWWLQRSGRLRRASTQELIARIAPMVAMACLAVGVTAGVERQARTAWQQHTHGILDLPSFGQRVVVALNAPWFYVATLLAPFWIAPIFPKWAVSPGDPKWWLAGVAWLVLFASMRRWWNRIDGVPRWGMVQFGVALLPALGLVPFTYQHNSYVAARFLYLPCIGAGVTLAWLAEWAGGSRPGTLRRATAAGAAIALLAGAAALTYREARYWQTNLSFWLHAFERYPDNYAINSSLGSQYQSDQQWLAAAQHYRRAHERLLVDPAAFKSYLDNLGKAQGPQAVIEACAAELAHPGPNPHVAHLYRAQSYEQLGRNADAIADYERARAIARPSSDTGQRARRALERLRGPEASHQ